MTTASSAANDGTAANAEIATPSAAAYSDGRLKERRVMELPLDVLSDRRAWAARVRKTGCCPIRSRYAGKWRPVTAIHTRVREFRHSGALRRGEPGISRFQV